jgi:hypothetical protein
MSEDNSSLPPIALLETALWPKSGDKMRFLAKNGYDYQLEAALDVFEPDAVVTVKRCIVHDWSHEVEFAELPGKLWNGVMFKLLPPSRVFIRRHARVVRRQSPQRADLARRLGHWRPD